MDVEKITKVYTKVSPLLEKKIPFFSQTIKQFGGSKSNVLGIVLIIAGIVILFRNIDSSVGLNLVMFGCSLLTIKDAVHKVGS